METKTTVPSLLDAISNCPPRSLTRSLIPVRPTPPLPPLRWNAANVSIGMPEPKSLTVSVSSCFSRVKSICTRELPECRWTFVRLARWLLMTQDRVHLEILPLTHDLLADMLGTRRSSVTVAAGILQEAGIIDYRRGKVHILNRPKLEEAACECYPVVHAQLHAYLDTGMVSRPQI